VPFYIETLVFLGFAIDEHIGYLSGVRVTQSLILCVCFVDRCLSFFAIVLSVLLRFTAFTKDLF
jgi:hypothetical protein